MDSSLEAYCSGLVREGDIENRDKEENFRGKRGSGTRQLAGRL
jgi:hypothetical protein